MSGFAVAKEPVERLYTASLYYILRTVSNWEVHLVVTQDTETHNTVVREYYENVNAVEGPHIPIEFERESIELDIPIEGIDVNGWRIIPLVTPVISKRQVDYIGPGRRIPCIQMKATYMLPIPQGGTPPELFYPLSINGAKEPNNKIFIDSNFSKEKMSTDSSVNPSTTSEVPTASTEPPPLSLTDFSLVYETLYPARPNWYNLGLALNLPPPILDEIENREKPGDCLQAILHTRMKKIPRLTWKDIIEALRHPAVGEIDLAMRIERQYYPYRAGAGDEATHILQSIDDKDDENEDKIRAAQESKKIYDKAMEAGYVTMKTKNVLLFGMAGTGKTSTKHIILGLSPPENRDSTPLASAPERVDVRDISGVKVQVEKGVWKPVTVDDYQQIVADIVRSLAGNLEEVPKELATALEQLQSPSEANPRDESDRVENPERVDQDQVASIVADDLVQNQNAKESPKSDEIRTLITSIAGEIKVHVGRLIDAKASGRRILGSNWVYFIDSGGQPHFYNLLPLFVDGISAALYFLRLSEGLNDHPRVEYYKDGKPLGKSYVSPLTTAANFKYLVRSIQSRSSNLRLVCIGTHLDKVEECSETETVKQKNDRLLELLPESIRGNVQFSNIAQNEVIFPIDATNLGPAQEEMAKKLQTVILGCPSNEFDVPIWWFTFEIIVEKITSKLSRKVLSKAQCVDIAHELNFHENALIEALRFFHKHHIFHYYPDILPDVVFCSTQVIMDKITELVEYASLLKDSSSTESKSGKWFDFRDRGIVPIEFLNEFKQHYVKDIFEPADLIEIFKHLLIITPLSDTPSDKSEYFMPAILDVLPTSELEKHRCITSSEVAPLLVQFENGWPRCGVFCCLQVYLVQHCGWHFGKRLRSNPPKQNVVKLHPKIGCSVTLIDSLTYIEVHVQAPSPILASICPRIRADVECGTKAACNALHYKDSDLQLAFFCPPDCKSLLDDTFKPPTKKRAKPESHTAVVQWEYKYMCCSEKEDNCSPLENKHKIWWGQTSAPVVPELTLRVLAQELRVLTYPIEFGNHLNIPQEEVIIIEKNHRSDIKGQKTALFQYIADNYKSLGITWSSIADALLDIHAGNLSLNIREKYCSDVHGSENAQPKTLTATRDVPSPPTDKQQEQTASDLSHDIESKMIATPTKPKAFGALSDTKREKYINIKHDFPGIEVVAQTDVLVTNSPDTFKWEGHGFTIDIPADSLPESVDQCVLGIYASISGQYELPGNHKLVSAVYWVRPEPYCDFKRPLTVELQHCAQKSYSKNLSFVRAVCTQKTLPYTFKKIEGSGTFVAESSYGSIKLDHFSGYGVTAEGPVERLYTAGLYYLGENVHSWEIHLVVTWDIKTQNTAVQKYYEEQKREVHVVPGPFLAIEFEKEKIELDVPMDGVNTSGWRVRPLITPLLMQKQVDFFGPGKHIPCCQFKAKYLKQEEKPQELFHRLRLNGAKEPNNLITIDIEPGLSQLLWPAERIFSKERSWRQLFCKCLSMFAIFLTILLVLSGCYCSTICVKESRQACFQQCYSTVYKNTVAESRGIVPPHKLPAPINPDSHSTLTPPPTATSSHVQSGTSHTIQKTSGTVIQPGVRPKMTQLLNFTLRDGTTINIVTKIGKDYPTFGTHLLEDSDKVNNIEQDHHYRSEPIVNKMLNEWVKGKGRLPVTWETLVNVLETTGLKVLADDIRGQYEQSSTGSHNEEL